MLKVLNMTQTQDFHQGRPYKDSEDSAYPPADAPVTPLTRDEAKALLASQPRTRYSRVIWAQLAVSVVGALVAYALTGRQQAGWSALAGGLIVAVPSALMLYGVMLSPLRLSIMNPLVWMMVKMAATLLMFMLAIRALGQPEWLALMINLIVALKMFWIAAWKGSSSKNPSK